MAENVTNDLIYSVLEKMQADMSELKFDTRDIKIRMTMVEEHIGSSLIATSGVHSKLDRLVDRVERVESRLDLSDAR